MGECNVLILLGNTSPESSTTLPASSAVTHITYLESSLGSSVDLSVLPASSMLSALASANEITSSLNLTTMTSLLTLSSFVIANKPITCIDDKLPYADPYIQTLPYSDDIPMDDTPLS